MLPLLPSLGLPVSPLAMTCKPALTTRSVNQDRNATLSVHFTQNKRCYGVHGHFVPVIVGKDKPWVFLVQRFLSGPGCRRCIPEGFALAPFPREGYIGVARLSFRSLVWISYRADGPIPNALRAGRSACAISMGTVFPPKAPAPLENEQI